jgi:hypothetical protein
MKIQVLIKNVYGIEKAYPACKLSNLFANIAGTITLTESTIKDIKELGYKIEANSGSKT